MQLEEIRNQVNTKLKETVQLLHALQLESDIPSPELTTKLMTTVLLGSAVIMLENPEKSMNDLVVDNDEVDKVVNWLNGFEVTV